MYCECTVTSNTYASQHINVSTFVNADLYKISDATCNYNLLNFCCC